MMRKKTRSRWSFRRFMLRGDVAEAFVYARWAPSAAFMAVYLGGGDTVHLTCAMAFAGWPTFQLLRNA